MWLFEYFLCLFLHNFFVKLSFDSAKKSTFRMSAWRLPDMRNWPTYGSLTVKLRNVISIWHPLNPMNLQACSYKGEGGRVMATSLGGSFHIFLLLLQKVSKRKNLHWFMWSMCTSNTCQVFKKMRMPVVDVCFRVQREAASLWLNIIIYGLNLIQDVIV